LGSEIVYDGWVLLVHAGSARSLTDAGQGRFRFCHVTLPGVSAGNPSPGYVAVAMVVIVDRQSRLHPTACIYLDHTRPHRHDQEMTVTVPLLIGAFSIAAYFLLTSPRRSPEVHADADALTSVLIPAYTSHSRSLPKQSKHAFSYPLLYLGVDVDALEAGALDLPGRIVRYGGRPITKLLGLRSDGYLEPGSEGLRAKVERLLDTRGIPRTSVGRIWLVTMPSCFGFEGINPLSTWFVYHKDGRFLSVILEVHNTFGEK
jgi:hypothetical protein